MLATDITREAFHSKVVLPALNYEIVRTIFKMHLDNISVLSKSTLVLMQQYQVLEVRDSNEVHVVFIQIHLLNQNKFSLLKTSVEYKGSYGV